jgi:hypothetical protein
MRSMNVLGPVAVLGLLSLASCCCVTHRERHDPRVEHREVRVTTSRVHDHADRVEVNERRYGRGIESGERPGVQADLHHPPVGFWD